MTLAKEWLLSTEESVNPFYFAGRVLLFLFLALWGWKFITTPLDTNFVRLLESTLEDAYLEVLGE